MLEFLFQSDRGLFVRVSFGAAFFLLLAIVDLRQRGRAATRWREYLFLLACVGAAMIYGVLNDVITSTMSPEYFLYGKGLADRIGGTPSGFVLHVEAAKVGIKATWTAGLILGVALLIANNPRAGLPPLPYRRLFARLGWIVGSAIVFAVVLGVAGYLECFGHFSDDFATMLRRDEMRPRRFQAVFGVHLGGYIGGLIGCAVAVVSVLRARRRTS